MDHMLTVAALLVEALVLLWAAKQLWGRVLRRNVDLELTTHDNPAAALTVAGYFMGVFIALAGVMASPTQGLIADMLSFLAFGTAGVLVLFCSLFAAPYVGGIQLQRDILDNRNVGCALVLAASFIATGLIFNGAVRGEGAGLHAWMALLAFQFLGQLVLALVGWLFEVITPFDLHKEIVEGQNLAAAVGYAGALVAMGFMLQNAVTGEFVSWEKDLFTFAKYCLPLVLLWPIRALVVNGVLLGFRNLDHEIAVDRNVGAGVVEAVAYVGFALLVVTAA